MKKCQFVRRTNINAYGNTEISSIFVPMPNSWERHQWLKNYFGQECAVVGKEFWNLLIERFEAKVLVEKDGVFWEEEV